MERIAAWTARGMVSERAVSAVEYLKFTAAKKVGSEVELVRLRDEAIRTVKLLKHRGTPVMRWPDHTFDEHLFFELPGIEVTNHNKSISPARCTGRTTGSIDQSRGKYGDCGRELGNSVHVT